MVTLVQQRLGRRADILRADFGKPLDFVEACTCDIVVSALALDYVKDWAFVFKEFFRVLRPAAQLVFSVGHPCDEFYDHHKTGNYFDVERVDYVWQGGGTPVRVPYYRRPFSAMIDPLLEAGFILERVLEPGPIEQFKEHEPRDYEKLMRQPGFICFRVRKSVAA
jgi:SAM-dependent methyltransferase